MHEIRNSLICRGARHLVVALLALAAAQVHAGYVFTDLGSNLNGISQAFGINNKHQIVGSGFYEYAVHWTGTQFVTLGSPPAGTSTYTGANGINNNGQIAGTRYFASYPAVLRSTIFDTVTDTASMTSINGGSWNAVFSINDSGLAVGWRQSPSSALRAISWDGVTETDLGTLGGTTSQASGINSFGHIAGFASTSNDLLVHAVVWSGGAVADIGTLGGSRSEGRAINDRGQVVGYSYLTGDKAGHATLWDGSDVVDLGTLGTNHSDALAINSEGVIVGESGVPGDIFNHATLWINGQIIDLNDYLDDAYVAAGWVLTRANDISDSGWIVGSAYNPRLQRYHGFLLAPDQAGTVPEPSTVFLVALALAAIGAGHARARAAKGSPCRA